MGVHCYLPELGTLVTMAAKIAAVITLASLCAAEPGYGYGYGYGISAVAYHPFGGYSSEYRSTQGLTGYGGYYGKREAEPGYGYGGYSHVYRTTEGLTEGGYHKRSAEPGYGYHHGHGQSYVHQDRDHYHGSYGYEIEHDYKKRSAEAGYGHGGDSYQYVNRPYSDYKIEVYNPQTYHHGYGKRSAEPGYGSAYVHVEQKDHGYGYPESYEYGYNIHKRSAEPGYGSNESYQEVSNTPYSHYDIKVYHPY